MTCPYYDCGYCYAPPERNTNAQQGGCQSPNKCPEKIRMEGKPVPDHEYLERIEEAAFNVIAGLNPKDFPNGGVNWGAMGSPEAQKITTLDGEHWQVLIDEVAPEACELRMAIRVALSEAGFPDVHVITEW